MAFDIRKLDWSQEIFEAAGIDPGLFSEPVLSGSRACRILPDRAEELGLSEELLLVPTGHDQVAAAIGSGVFQTGQAVDGAGGVDCITPVFSGIPADRGIYDGG